MITWGGIEDAIQDWAAAVDVDVPAIWAAQNSPRPVGDKPYIDLRASARQVGLGWVDYDDAAAPSAGAELDATARAVWELNLSVRCFAGSERGRHRGAGAPQGLLQKMTAQAGLPTRRDLLNAAGWAPARFDPIAVLGEEVGDAFFEPRAQFQCFGFVASEVTETATYIQILEFTNLITGGTFTLDVEAP